MFSPEGDLAAAAEKIALAARERGFDDTAVARLFLGAVISARRPGAALGRGKNAGAGKTLEVSIENRVLRIRCSNGDEFCLLDENGLRWRCTNEANRPISRNEIEERLGVWPGYTDALEDVFAATQVIREEVEKKRSELGDEFWKIFHDAYAALEEKIVAEVEQRRGLERHAELRRWRQKTGVSPKEAPKCLKPVRHVKHLDISLPCHVYFLLKDETVVYVGQTSAPWPARILSHLRDDSKSFDDVWYLEVDRGSLNLVEQRYIRQFNPPLNQQGKEGRDQEKNG